MNPSLNQNIKQILISTVFFVAFILIHSTLMLSKSNIEYSKVINKKQEFFKISNSQREGQSLSPTT